MPPARRNSNVGRFLRIVLAIVWTAGLLLAAWYVIRPQSLADRVSEDRKEAKRIDANVASSHVNEPTLSSLPGGNLPIKPAELSATVHATARTELSDATGNAPRQLPDAVAGRPLTDQSEMASPLDDPPAANRPTRLPHEADLPATVRPIVGKPGLGAIEASSESDAKTIAWSRLKLRELMRCLDASDPSLTAGAQKELQRRGIAGPLADFARLAGATDPEIRRAFVESLPRLSGVDARPWLLELSYDDDPRVRTAAVTLMATSGDIELLKRVQQVALEDPDDHARSQAEKALPVKPVERR
jgi:hypothetical protein